MGHIKEPKEIDFYVQNRKLNDKEKKRISDFIQQDQSKHKKVPPLTKTIKHRPNQSNRSYDS